MIFSKASAVLLLKASKLEIYPSEGEKVVVSFTDEEVSHLELVNKEKTAAVLVGALGKMNPQKAVLVLSKQVVFEKIIEKAEEAGGTESLDFFEQIPFDKAKVSKKEVLLNSKKYLFATNKTLYELINKVCLEKGWRIEAVVPFDIFSLESDDNLSTGNVSEILGNSDLIESANFIGGAEVESNQIEVNDGESSPETTGQPEPSYIKYVAVVLFTVAMVLVIYSIRQGFKLNTEDRNVKTEESKLQQLDQATSSANVSIGPTASPSAILKEDIKIEVLNGSGKAGQAAKIKDLLLEEGYKNIDIGNATGALNDQTVVAFTANVGKDIQDEILSLIKNSFTNEISSMENASSSAYEVIITTGK